MSVLKYIRRAFANRWNLLGLFGGIGFALLSGRPEVGLPLVAAAEAAWLGLVGTHPAFRRHVDLQDHAQQDERRSEAAEERMRRIERSLPRSSQVRFRQLMEQCRELRVISRQISSTHSPADGDDLQDQFDSSGLDRLLWLFLKLLYTEHSLDRFFETTTRDQIDRDLQRVQERIRREEERPQNEQRQRILETLRDNLKTAELRLQNFAQARDSYELVKAEQQRLESRIRSLAEMGISRGDPAALSHQVDSVAGSIAATEKTLNDLRFVTGFTAADESVPEILPRAMQQTT